MKPVSPVIPGENFPETIIAKDQDEYQNLPAIVVDNHIVVSRWQLTFRERLQVLFGGSIYLWCWTFRNPLQPVVLETKKPALKEAA